MNLSIFGLAVCLAVAELPVGTELQYSGTLSQQTKLSDTEVKSFTLITTIAIGDDGQPQVVYQLEERGGGAWGWPEQFGTISTGTLATKMNPIRILLTHDDQQYPLPVRSPVFEFPDKLALQTSWNDGKKEYLVTRKRNVKNRDAFQIEVTANAGRNQTLVIESAHGILLSLDEKVVIGRGDEFRMKLELVSQKQISAEELAKFSEAKRSLVGIQSELGRTAESRRVELTSGQLSVVRNQIPAIEKQAEGTSWTRLVSAIARDLKQQQKRLDGLAGLEQQLVGKPAPDWTLKLADGGTVSQADLKGQVTVLHFWQYRSEPLSEPYGQIGYLDYLNNKRKKLGIRVIGIDVDERFANPEQKGVAIRSMRKLLEFMNIGYQMAIDDGSELMTFGDPRSVGAPLPLWVVIGHDGNVSHCHTGYYDIKPDEGLKELDEAVIAAAKRQKAGK